MIREQYETNPAPWKKHALHCIVFALGVALIFNILGALITFFYFAFVQAGLQSARNIPETEAKFIYFVLRASAIFVVVNALGIYTFRPMIKRLRRKSYTLSVETVGNLLSLPAYMAGFSLVGWAAAAIVFGVVPIFLNEFSGGPWHRATHSLLGITLVGGPFTVISVYLVLERIMPALVQRFFPLDMFVGVPRSFRISVLLKMIAVLLLIGLVPVSVVSFLTLQQIHLVQNGSIDFEDFLARMPFTIGFLLFFAVASGTALSILIAHTVSLPLRQAGTTMERIREGDLNVTIPVLSNDEIGLMLAGLNRMVEGLRERDTIRETFGMYLSPDVVTRLLRSPESVNLGGQLKEITILVADLRGFTACTANLKPELVLKLVNMYLEKMVEIILKHGGIIDEFTGDGILAFFGAPKYLPDSQMAALRCAVEMQEQMPEFNREISEALPEIGSRELTMGIAVNSGELVVGNIGSEKRKKYGAVGVPINIAFRVEKLTPGNQILITEPVYEKVREIVQTETIENVCLKGIDTAVTLYRILKLD
ncbi:adenylate/guanylate cyclase domain-containing protein [Desulfomonile tiedjei]|uniref:Family 3 adenylate cyclase n=1 Tax=Desulfomonile tiedjei (strain ATCC 49306 / DSM 6799 / DCB-1) TaxID=706587 RepID=I4CEW8_DESTA|nr:adenylate/guanylate cyclase domain-containing protein [Desulfomonile tiedjei]AFM28109.1 family 3 adenylate cyclase [Desulfomonile tiedjei DSM 6799]